MVAHYFVNYFLFAAGAVIKFNSTCCIYEYYDHGFNLSYCGSCRPDLILISHRYCGLGGLNQHTSDIVAQV